MRHLLEAVDQALTERNFYAALTLAVTLPDICGWIEEPLSRTTNRYSRFFNERMASHYTKNIGGDAQPTTFLTADDFYALRCSLVHQGRDDFAAQTAQRILQTVEFIVPPPGWTIHCNMADGKRLQLQVDVFCRQIVAGVSDYLDTIVSDSDQERRCGSLMKILGLDGGRVQVLKAPPRT